MENTIGLIAIVLFFAALIAYELLMEKVWRAKWLKKHRTNRGLTVKEKGLLIVVTEYDLADGETIVLGIVNSNEEGVKLLEEYYGKELIVKEPEMVEWDAFRYTVRLRENDNSISSVSVTGQYFYINNVR